MKILLCTQSYSLLKLISIKKEILNKLHKEKHIWKGL